MTLLTRRWAVLRPHELQAQYWNSPHRFNVVSAGRRSGKTELAKRKLIKRALRGTLFENPRFFAAAPTRDQAKNIYWEDLKRLIPPSFLDGRPSETELSIRLITGAELRVVGMDKPERIEGQPWDGGILDEYGNMRAEAWGANVRPALSDRLGWCDFVGVPEGENHYKDLNDMAEAQYALHGGASEWRPFTWTSSTVLPQSEVESARRDLPPKMFQQEYEGAWVNWAGTAFFTRDTLLVDGKPAEMPVLFDAVFATIDSAMKEGKPHDGTGCVYWGLVKYGGRPRLYILDWELIQVDGAVLESWLPSVLARLDQFCRENKVNAGSLGAWIEDAQSGTILLQQARKHGWKAYPIDSKLTSMGKDGRAFAVSPYAYQGRTKITAYAYEKVSDFKGDRRNHFLSQVTGFRIGVPDAVKRADDLADCFFYGPMIALGNYEGF